MFIETKKLLEHILDGSELIYDCQFHPHNHDWIGLSTIEGDIKMINSRNNEFSTVFELNKYHKGNPIRKIRFYQHLMFSISKSIKITDLNNQKLIRKISNGSKKIYSLLVANDYLVCIGDDDGNFKVWDYRVDRPIYMSLHECENYISDLDINSNRQLVVASSGEGTLTAFNIRARKMEEPQSELFDSGFQCVRFAEEKNKVVVGAEDGVINIFNNNEWGNIIDRYPLKKNNNGQSSIDCLEVLDDENNCFVFGSSDGSIEAISLFPHRHLKTLVNNNSSIENLDVNQITQRVVGVTENKVQLFSYEIIKSEEKNVLQVQQKLKNDVEKKQNDLKLLIGERYNELFRATDSFEKMNSSINELVSSLKSLSCIIQNNNGTKPIDRCSEQNLYDEDNFFMTTICKFFFDLPLQIWDYLHHDNFILATYCSFYGNYIAEFLVSQSNISKLNNALQSELCFFRSKCIKNLTFYIIRNCWFKINEQSTSNNIDLFIFADIFSCLILLKKCTISGLIKEFFEKQTNNIQSKLVEINQISSLIETVINVIFNTIKCSKIFNNQYHESIFTEHFKYIIDSNFSTEIITQTRQSTKLPRHLTTFSIRNHSGDIDFDNTLKQENVFDRTSIEKWIQSIQENFRINIENKFKVVTSISKLFFEITTVEKRQMEDLKFKGWNEFRDILDINDWIWKKWFLNAFETRVYEITQKKMESILEAFILLLPSFEQILLNCDLNIVEFIWKDHHSYVNANNKKSNDFISLITKSCKIIDSHFKSFHEDIIIFKDNYQNFLEKIFLNIREFLFALKSHIDSYINLTKPFLLFGAVLFEKILELCPSLNQIFSIKDKNHTSSSVQTYWNQIEDEMKSISESYLLEWFVIIISNHFARVNPNTFIDLIEFLKNFSMWETVSLSSCEETISIIEVPIQLSISTFEVLQNICNDINRFCAHMVSRKMLIDILILIGKHLLFLYETSIKNLTANDSLPKASKQIMSIQLYFDLFFIKKIFTTTRDETLRTNYLSKINELMTLLENNIDPFDMHLIHPYIELNCDKLHKSYQITFGFLFFERHSNQALYGAQKKNLSTENNFAGRLQNKEIIHNLMLIYSCSEEFKTDKINSLE